ncbi:MAG: TetR/AcrR family transcriptional regulator [Bacteroidota bacterium]
MSVKEKKAAKIEAMLREGMEILWSNGYNGTSVNDIVSAAGVPKGSFYFYFDSKDDFVLKALERYYLMECKPAFRLLEEKNKSAKERLLSFYRFRNENMKEELNCEKGSMICNISNEMSEHNEAIRSKIKGLHAMTHKKIIKVVDEAQEEGSMKKNIPAAEVVDFIENVFNGALITMKENKNGKSLDSALEIVEMSFFQ